jgi:hypothetical protein
MENPSFPMIGGVLVLAGYAFLVFVAILWTILPFAIFGIKKRLDMMIDILQAIGRRMPDEEARVGRGISIHPESDDIFSGLRK